MFQRPRVFGAQIAPRTRVGTFTRPSFPLPFPGSPPARCKRRRDLQPLLLFPRRELRGGGWNCPSAHALLSSLAAPPRAASTRDVARPPASFRVGGGARGRTAPSRKPGRGGEGPDGRGGFAIRVHPSGGRLGFGEGRAGMGERKVPRLGEVRFNTRPFFHALFPKLGNFRRCGLQFP